MAFVPAPNIVMLEMIGTKDGQIIENRVNVNCQHEPTVTDLGTIGGVAATWIDNFYQPLLPVDVVLTTLKMTSLHEENGIQSTVAINFPGVVANPSAPNEVTYCISLRTGFSGRSARGRFYWLGLAVANIATQNRVGAAFRTGATNAVQSLINNLVTSGYIWTIVSYVSGGVPRPGGPVYFDVLTATTTDDIVDSQRRRRPGIGQ